MVMVPLISESCKNHFERERERESYLLYQSPECVCLRQQANPGTNKVHKSGEREEQRKHDVLGVDWSKSRSGDSIPVQFQA